ncbi:GNAT family N-acetyltransferase [Hymenobacter psychrophilus]|uniref:Acetyltransferase (GNAT) domain-containing protein n=1 Tax=Hymenobacter psychrophilus TaxID=651662 RepID=A0A1H3BZX0_9BACT|nr:GNAT family N-acetyltransferase [Hymenobacter psychrophilus]SDX47315.1 Acetyltransferase (GNAT) domain-containing protein [Hymenobacter psychrophilus]
MFRYIGPENLDRAQWDALITADPNGLVYALSWYLDRVAPGWAALVKYDAQGRYIAGLPLPVRSKFGFRFLRQPVFTQQLGLFSREPPTPADLQQISKLLRRRFRFITQYSFNTANTANTTNTANTGLLAADVPALADFGVATRHTYYIDLQPAYPQLAAGYHASRRRQLRQARSHGLRVEAADGPEALETLIRLFAENTAANIAGLLGEAYEYPLLRALYAAARQRGMAELWQARTPAGEVVAAVLLWKFNGQLIYLFNSSSRLGKQQRAISVLVDALLQRYAGQPLRFDFESPQVPSLDRFYASFGSVKTPFLSITLNQLPWPVRQLKAARTALVRAWLRRRA